MFAYLLLIVGIVLALCAYNAKSIRLYLAGLSMVVMGVGSGMVFAENPSVFGLGFLFFSIYQIFNIARLVVSRLHSKYLRAAFLVGGSRILMFQAIFLVLALITRQSELPIGIWFLAVQAGAASILLATITARIIASSPRRMQNYLTDSQLPSISVLIPARNENTNLEEMLKTVIANDYPKLEVIVLDDCSSGKQISEIVKKYAHAGVRFVQGDMPRENWLAKNQAYETLASNASGDWLVFMGVDVRLGVGSLRSLVHYAIKHNAMMLSVLPRRFDGAFWAGFFSPLRYFRELSKPGFGGRFVPALSTLWVISREGYQSCGGMASVARKIIPEHYFAKRLARLKLYSFVRTNDYLQVSTSKSLREQIATSLRVLYPGHHRRLEWSAITMLTMFLFMLLPFIQLTVALVNGVGGLALVLPLFAVAMLTFSHLLITTVTNPILWPLAIINLPYLTLQEIILDFLSMYKYEFDEIHWKGRNICLPVMHVYPNLPKQ